MLVSNKISFGEKTISTLLIIYLHNNKKAKRLHIMLPKTSANVKIFDEQTKLMYFLIKDDGLLEIHNTILNK